MIGPFRHTGNAQTRLTWRSGRLISGSLPPRAQVARRHDAVQPVSGDPARQGCRQPNGALRQLMADSKKKKVSPGKRAAPSPASKAAPSASRLRAPARTQAPKQKIAQPSEELHAVKALARSADQ